MAKLELGPSPTSVIFRVKLMDSSVATGAGKTGLAYDTASLIISTIQNDEATATAYTQAAGTIETIATLGTYAAPTATKCRFKEVDSTNHPGVYEIQLADARFASCNSLIVSISGAADLAECDIEFDLSFGGATLLTKEIMNQKEITTANGNTTLYDDDGTTPLYTVAAAYYSTSTKKIRKRLA
jgi:hypothetical protein